MASKLIRDLSRDDGGQGEVATTPRESVEIFMSEPQTSAGICVQLHRPGYSFEGATFFRRQTMPSVACGLRRIRMGRESPALEPAALSFLSAVDTDLGLDAVLFLRRTGLVLASWTREGIRLDIVSVMAATMLASIDTIVEALGGSIPQSVSVDSGQHQMVATKVNAKAFLVVIAPKRVSRRVVRQATRDLLTHLAAASTTARAASEKTASHDRVNVRPPR
jgi:predicted regulator of Ras-like GTPase activity (Roadblock/LC7/MglB family)